MDKTPRLTYNKPSKVRNEFPSLEKLRCGITCAFTVNPEHQYFDFPDRLFMVLEDTQKALATEYAYYKFYTELSPTGRIHYHGWITIINPLRFYLGDVHRLTTFGTLSVKIIPTLEDFDEWEIYCIKQAHIMTLYDKKGKILLHSWCNVPKMALGQGGKETKTYLSNKDAFKLSAFRDLNCPYDENSKK